MKKPCKGTRKSLWRRVGLALLGLLLGVNFYVLNAQTVGGNRLPMPFGIGAATVQSGSMEPTYYKGDLLFVREPESYQPEDIVVYQSGGTLVVHRIIAMDGDRITTQGDANNTPDEPFDVSCIKGKVVGRIPAAGLVIDFFKTPIGILLLLGGALLLTELSFRKDKKAKTTEPETAPEPDENAKLRAEIERLKKELADDRDETKSEKSGTNRRDEP